jgi:uncharacterized SAM-binding protein YcdF (DUF218 family)
VASGLGLLWLLSCNAVAIWLAQTLLPPVLPLPAGALQSQKIQAVVVLGGGALPEAPEYGEAQPAAPTLARLRYGLRLARESGLPVAFAGGVGWAAVGMPSAGQPATEGTVAQRVAQKDFGATLRWVDERSRDTAENAQRLAKLMHPDGALRIALVTDAVHVPRAAQACVAAGFEVTPAPTGFVLPRQRALLEWLPSAHGLRASREVLHEALGLIVARAVTAAP